MSDDERVPAVSPDLPSTGWRLTLAALNRLPQGVLSRGFGAIADTPIPRAIRRKVLGQFARTLGINVDEAELPLEEYGSANEFFVRKLKPGLRSWSADGNVAGSPVDGVVGQFGACENGTLIQAKGRWYTAGGLLDDVDEAKRYQHGSFLTIYLSPRHYHRIHAPATGVIAKARHVPGRLLPVNAAAVSHIENLFAINERLICYIDSKLGRIAVVAVGAYNVGRISAAFDPAWADGGSVTNRRSVSAETKTYQPPISITAGDEIMAFHLGSTVVMLFEDRVTLESALSSGEEIRLGEIIARV